MKGKIEKVEKEDVTAKDVAQAISGCQTLIISLCVMCIAVAGAGWVVVFLMTSIMKMLGG